MTGPIAGRALRPLGPRLGLQSKIVNMASVVPMILFGIFSFFPEAIACGIYLPDVYILPTIPSEFKCPLSLALMIDPVVASDGCTYERDNIRKWLNEHYITSPTTNETLESCYLFKNSALQNLIKKSQAGAACKVRTYV